MVVLAVVVVQPLAQVELEHLVKVTMVAKVMKLLTTQVVAVAVRVLSVLIHPAV